MSAINVTERIDTVTVSDSAEIKFSPAYPIYAIKGESIKATLIKDVASDETSGVYSTDDNNGFTIIANPTMKDTLYLSGSGDVRVWGGEDAAKCPFV